MRMIVLTASLITASALYIQAYGQEYLEGHLTHTRMQEVAQGRYQETVETMNHMYETLAEMLDKTGQRKLQTAQGAWQKFSEAECAFDTDYARGEPLEKLIYQDCLISRTEERTATLKRHLQHNYTIDPSLALNRAKK